MYFDMEVWDSRLTEVNLHSHKLLSFYSFQYPANVFVFRQKSLVLIFVQVRILSMLLQEAHKDQDHATI